MVCKQLIEACVESRQSSLSESKKKECSRCPPMLASLLSLSPPRTEIWRSVWSWSRPPQVKFSLVLPSTNLPPHTGLKTVQSLPSEWRSFIEWNTTLLVLLTDHIQKPDYALSPSGRPNSDLVPSNPVIWSPVIFSTHPEMRT